MTVATIFFTVLYYAAAAIFVVGMVVKIASFVRTPAPLKIPTPPAPTTTGGVLLRMLREIALFQSLFKSNRWIWVLGILFHASLLLVLIRHLFGFLQPTWFWAVWVQAYFPYAGFVMVAALFGLWGRRFLVERIRYISTYSDHLMLVLLVGIGASGLVMRFIEETDLVTMKAFFIGLMSFDPQPLPVQLGLYVHLLLVALLMIVFPFSKLLHVPGVFFSPSRNQTDDPRAKRHLAPWAAKLEKT